MRAPRGEPWADRKRLQKTIDPLMALDKVPFTCELSLRTAGAVQPIPYGSHLSPYSSRLLKYHRLDFLVAAY